MSIYDPNPVFILAGVRYEHAIREPQLEGVTVRRFTYGEEPCVIAQVPLAGGGVVEVHGYAQHWTPRDVVVAWTDDHGREHNCWVPASDVRRPDPSEWHGRYLPR